MKPGLAGWRRALLASLVCLTPALAGAQAVPSPPPAPVKADEPPPFRISGLVYGDYYYVAANHRPELEDQNGFWIRRVYLTYDHTLSKALSVRARLEANGKGDFESTPHFASPQKAQPTPCTVARRAGAPRRPRAPHGSRRRRSRASSRKRRSPAGGGRRTRRALSRSSSAALTCPWSASVDLSRATRLSPASRTPIPVCDSASAPEARAECTSSARSDLCGGRRPAGVPEPSKRHAHRILPEGGCNSVAADVLITKTRAIARPD